MLAHPENVGAMPALSADSLGPGGRKTWQKRPLKPAHALPCLGCVCWVSAVVLRLGGSLQGAALPEAWPAGPSEGPSIPQLWDALIEHVAALCCIIDLVPFLDLPLPFQCPFIDLPLPSHCLPIAFPLSFHCPFNVSPLPFHCPFTDDFSLNDLGSVTVIGIGRSTSWTTWRRSGGRSGSSRSGNSTRCTFQCLSLGLPLACY